MTTKRPSRTTEETKAEFDNVAKGVRSQSKLSPRERELQAAKEAEIKASVSDLAVERVLQKLTSVGLETQKALAAVQTELAQQTQLLDNVRAAVQLEQQELETLHGKDIAACALEDLVTQFEVKKATLTLDLQEAEASIARQRAALDMDFAEYKAMTAKERQREEAEFAYQRDQGRRAEQDHYAEAQRETQRAERDRKEQLEKMWGEREAALQAQEKAVAELKAQVEAFPAKLEAEVKKAEAIVGSTVKRDYEHRIALMTKDHEVAQRESKVIITNLEQLVASLRKENEALQTRLAGVDDKVKDIAVKALESASSKQTLAEFSMLQQGRDNGTGRGKSA